jgi:peptidoglycan/xylan/chitin deacetylase (PgdA/CDA1 family)
MFIFAAVSIAVVTLAHMLPAPFVLDWMAGERAVWRMPLRDVPTVYLTYDDGPNPATTPDLLDVLADERIHATFFLIDEHITSETAPIVRRTVSDGHAIGLHSSTRRLMLMNPHEFVRTLSAAARRIETVGGARPCAAFRPHAGWRGGRMYEGLRELDYKLVGWGWMLWDFNWFRARDPQDTIRRVAAHVSDGDIIVMHDGDESAPTRDQRHTVEATRRLIPDLRARGYAFGKIC